MKQQKRKIEPILITSREGMQLAVADIVKARLEAAAIHVEIEQRTTAIQREHQQHLDDLAREIATKEAGVFVWAKTHREKEFADRKSIDLATAVVGFEINNPSVEKKRSAGTWDDVALRLMALRITDPADADKPAHERAVVFNGEDYIRFGNPEVSKAKLIADRERIPAEVFAQLGIRIERDEIFYIRPKSPVAEASAQQAA